MKSKKTVKNWIFLAEGNLKTAKDKLASENPVTNTVCFHYQQCVEKYLKAYLTFIGKSFRKTYDIAELIEICKENDPDFQDIYKLNAHKITKYAVEVRYSDELYIPSLEETKEAIEIAEKVKEFIIAKLKNRNFEL